MRTAKLIVKPEQPLLSFNRLCFGMMNNDWILVASASVKLIITALLFIQVSIKSI